MRPHQQLFMKSIAKIPAKYFKFNFPLPNSTVGLNNVQLNLYIYLTINKDGRSYHFKNACNKYTFVLLE